ncbi:FliH/SctL family protein [uncultured Microbacterium sp.]|uniref:FliH/SctL family protein n=1 Tax=uncultured Microbacterium sp. TaxID=191216 RepID=UPI0028DC8F9C|nr:FliH/SctL family protein [uncultured Microbacterium sp.]
MSPEPAFLPLVAPRIGEPRADVRAETERARARGYADGYAEGRRVAREEARVASIAVEEQVRLDREEFAAAAGRALEALHAARLAVDARAADLEGVAVARIEDLALELSALIVGVELADPARSAAHALRRALEQAPTAEWVRVALDERDLAVLRGDATSAALLDRLAVDASPAVGPGGATVELAHGLVDTRIGAAFARAAAVLRGEDDEGVA